MRADDPLRDVPTTAPDNGASTAPRAEPIELLELVAIKIERPSVMFVKVEPRHFETDEGRKYIESISTALSYVLRVFGSSVRFLVVPSDIELSVVGEAYFTHLGYAKMPEPVGPVAAQAAMGAAMADGAEL